MNPTAYMVDYYVNGYEIVTRSGGDACLFIPRHENDSEPWVTVNTKDRYPAQEVEPVPVSILEGVNALDMASRA